MSLASEVKALIEEIKAKQKDWLALSQKADDEKRTLTADEKESLTTGNKALSDLVDQKVALETQIADQAELKVQLDKLDDSEKARAEAEQEATEKARSSAQKDEGKDPPWATAAIKALRSKSYSVDDPYKVEKSIKALFVEGTYTDGGSAGDYFAVPAGGGYPPEFRREPALLVPQAVRPIQFFNTIRQIPTTMPTETYMVETLLGTDAVEGQLDFIAEGGAYSEDPGYKYEPTSSHVKDIGTYYGVSRDILEDEPQMDALLRTRFTQRMARRLDRAFLKNDPTRSGGAPANEFTGVLNLTSIDTFVKESDEPYQVAISRAIEGINGPPVTGRANSGGQASADVVYVTVPIYWAFSRQQDALGNFMVSNGLREAPVLRVAGVPVMQVQDLPSGNILVMDREWVHIRDRRSVEIYWMDRVDTSGSQSKPTGQRMLVGDARALITVRRPAAVCLITGA